MSLLTVNDLVHDAEPADVRLPYGSNEFQFGDLYMPKGAGPFPVVVLIHGGCWQARFDIGHVGPMCHALRDLGAAVWSLEYRRLGHDSGGWPGTMVDVAKGTDHLRQLAESYPLDLTRVVSVGHSAGGHLGLWLAGRGNIRPKSILHTKNPLPLSGVISLAGIADLHDAFEAQLCDDAARDLMGGTYRQLPEHYEQASPIHLLPFGIPQTLINGQQDEIVPVDHVEKYADAALQSGDAVSVITIDNSAHFELITPGTVAFEAVAQAVTTSLKLQ